MLTAVMLKLSGRHYADNLGYCDNLFASLRHFGVRDVLRDFLIVAPAAEVPYVRTHAQHWSDFPVRVVTEEDELPVLARYEGLFDQGPWHRQQISKVHCATIVDTPFSLVLDPDVFATSPFRLHDVIRDGKALLEPEARTVHRRWWEDSAALLGVDQRLREPGISLENFAGFENHHFLPEDEAEVRLHSSVNVWSRDDLSKVRVDSFFQRDNPGLFGIIQSHVGLAPEELARLLAPYFPVNIRPLSPLHVYVAESARGCGGRFSPIKTLTALRVEERARR